MHQPLRELVQDVTRVIDRSSDEETIVAAVKSSMRKLVDARGQAIASTFSIAIHSSDLAW
jgi:ssDNA-binding replication factor A large subunit